MNAHSSRTRKGPPSRSRPNRKHAGNRSDQPASMRRKHSDYTRSSHTRSAQQQSRARANGNGSQKRKRNDTLRSHGRRTQANQTNYPRRSDQPRSKKGSNTDASHPKAQRSQSRRYGNRPEFQPTLEANGISGQRQERIIRSSSTLKGLIVTAVVVAAIALLSVFIIPRITSGSHADPDSPDTIKALSAIAVPTAATSTAFPLQASLVSFNTAHTWIKIEGFIEKLENKGYEVGFSVRKTDGTEVISYNADEPFYSASSIKGPYVLSLLSDDEVQISKSSESVLESIITYSDNEDYYALKKRYGVETINKWLRSTGADELLATRSASYIDITPGQLSSLWVQSIPYIESNNGKLHEYAETVFSTVEKSLLAETEDALTWSKAGWINDDDYSSTVDAGIVEAANGTYAISIMTDKGNDFSALQPLVQCLTSYMALLPASELNV